VAIWYISPHFGTLCKETSGNSELNFLNAFRASLALPAGIQEFCTKLSNAIEKETKEVCLLAMSVASFFERVFKPTERKCLLSYIKWC
jgi:hypothetical protein